MKFAERLAAHITPEWNSQYIKYDEMKEYLYHYEENAPVQDDEHLLQRYYARADEQFFQFCDKELVKINTFFAEKLAEASRKYENLKNELKQSNSLFTSHHKESGKKSKPNTNYDKEEEEEEEEEFIKTDEDENKKAKKTSKETPTLNRLASIKKKLIGESKSAEQQEQEKTFAQRILEKNRQRQLKQKQYRKEHDLKLAFSEFYLSLILLQNYQTLNFTGFRKILKKHDKIFKTDRGAEWHKTYVETAPFNVTKKVDTLINDVENLFTQHLEKGDRARAMKRLRVPPFEEKQSPWTTFRLGIFIGIIFVLMPLLISITVLAYAKYGEFNFNWKIAMRLYRSSFFIICHIFFIGINSYGWSRSGVNHVLIFEIDPRNHLTYQELLEVATFLGIIWFISLMSFVISAFYSIEYFVHPLALVTFLVIYLINPMHRFQYSSRVWLLKVLWCVFSAPFQHVAFAHFWLADQLTSFEFLFIDLQFFVCWFLFQAQWAPLKSLFPDSPCLPSSNRDLSIPFNLIAILLLCLPSWLRFLQCLRRFKDTENAWPHLANAFKYATTFMDVGALSLKYHFSYMYDSDWENPFFYLWLLTKFFATCYKLFWDIKMDWGFFDKNAGENKYLREVIVYSSKNYYYFAIIQNFLLRFIWLVRLYDINMKGETYKDIVNTGLGFLEVFRRFIWNFFRLENEHLNNCGQFRAVRDISISPIQVTDLAVIEKMMDDEDGVINRQHTLNTNPKLQSTSPNLTITKRILNKHPNLMSITKLFNSHHATHQNTVTLQSMFHNPPS